MTVGSLVWGFISESCQVILSCAPLQFSIGDTKYLYSNRWKSDFQIHERRVQFIFTSFLFIRFLWCRDALSGFLPNLEKRLFAVCSLWSHKIVVWTDTAVGSSKWRLASGGDKQQVAASFAPNSFTRQTWPVVLKVVARGMSKRPKLSNQRKERKKWRRG